MIPDHIQRLIKGERDAKHKFTFLKSLKEISVSKVATLAGSTYEVVRNAVELEQDHLLRRRAIRRILIRTGILKSGNPVDIAEDLLKELMWGKYTKKIPIPEIKIEEVGKIIYKYQILASKFHNKHGKKLTKKHAEDLYDILSFDIEKSIIPYDDRDALINLQYHYLAPLKLVRSPNLPEKFEDIQTYIYTLKTVTKFDSAMVRYYMFYNAFPYWKKPSEKDMNGMLSRLPQTLDDIEKHLDFKLKNRKYKEFIRQAVPIKFLNAVIEDNIDNAEEILMAKETRDDEVRIICNREYAETKKKVRKTMVRMIIYLFMTKMLFAMAAEIPFETIYLGHSFDEINYIPLAINVLFAPLLMAAIAMSFKIPYERNTQAIIEMIDRYMDPTKQRYSNDGLSRNRKKPFLHSIFNIFSFFIFLAVIGGISYVLVTYVHYNILSLSIFILFLSLISFAALKTRNVATELIVVPIKTGIFTPLIDMVATPILDMGKRLSEGVSKFSPLPLFFDLILDSPIKGFIRLFEEWNSYIKEKREEII